TVMSDSKDSTVIYTAASSPFGGLSDIGSLGVVRPKHEELPWMLDNPYMQSPPPPDFVPEPVYPEFMPLEDEILPAEVQPLPAAVSPTTDSPGYVPKSDLEEDPEEDDDEDLEEDPVDYPADGGDDGNDKDEPSDDDEDEEVDIEADDEEEEKHPAPADFTTVAAMIRLRAEAASTSHSLPLLSLSPIPDPTSSPPLLLPFTNRKKDILEVTLPPRKRLGIALGPRYEVGESSSAAAARPAGGLRMDYGFVATMDRDIRRDLERYVGYGITDSCDEIVEAMQGTPVVTDVAEFSQRMTESETRVRQDTDEIYTRLDDEQSERLLMAGRLNMLYRDRRAHDRTARIMEAEVVAQQAVITELQAADRRRQAVITKMLVADCRRQKQVIEVMIDQGVTAVLAAHDANTNDVDNHNSGTGTEGVVELTQLIEKMETVFRISNCSVENQIKFSTCTLLGNALMWWNSHVRTVGNDIAYAMTWTELKKKMTNKYCPRTEIKKLKVELWELKVKGTNVIGYNQRFQELALLCGRMFPEESDKIEKYVGGLPDMIYGSVVASKPKTMQEATEMEIKVMDKRIRTFANRHTENKRKQDNNQQHQKKRQNTDKAYAAGTIEKKQYGGSKHLCSKCNYHHDGLCAPKCHKCNKVGHFAHDCRSTASANNANKQKGTGSGQRPTCYESGVQEHFKRECPKLKNNNNWGNQVGGGNAPAKVYAVGHAGTNP
ncbi:putative reverse transcriptase domain-containing protein, partial [Tanacetum coccineum]